MPIYEILRIAPQILETSHMSLAKPEAVTMNYCQRAGIC